MSQQEADVEEVCMFTNSVLTAEQLIMGDPVSLRMRHITVPHGALLTLSACLLC